jgi:hypothetical protein
MGPLFSAAARRIMVDASQDPDLFEWQVMKAHGQTRTVSDQDAHPAPGDGTGEFVGWVQDYVKRAAKVCAKGEDGAREALYWTGYSVHAVEDLAAHRGRTNPEHAYNAAHDENPDEDPHAFDLAVDMARMALQGFLDGPLKQCKPAFASFNGRFVSYPEKLLKPFERKRDMTLGSLWDYKASAALYDKIKDDSKNRIRWFGETSTPKICGDDAKCVALMQRVVAP